MSDSSHVFSVTGAQTSQVNAAAALRLILSDHVIHPELWRSFSLLCKRSMGKLGKFTLHYKDVDFGGEFFSLTSTRDIKHKDTIKVVHIVEFSSLNLVEATCVEAN